MKGDGECRSGSCAIIVYPRHATGYIRKVGSTTCPAAHRQGEALVGRCAHPVAGGDRKGIRLGSAPVSVSDGVGVPVVVTAKLPAVPTVNVVLLALVMLGAVPPPPPLAGL